MVSIASASGMDRHSTIWHSDLGIVAVGVDGLDLTAIAITIEGDDKADDTRLGERVEDRTMVDGP